MADFGRFRITDGGIDIEYKAQGGETLTFTKFTLGDGYYSGAIRELTDVVHKVMDVEISRMNIQTAASTKKIAIGFDLDTSTISTGFYLREIGLYAKDPDTNQDVLVFYGNSGETADYISSSSSSTISEKLVDIELYISDVDNITAVIDSSLIYASQEDIVRLTNRINNINTKEYASTARLTTLNVSAWEQDIDTGNYDYIITDTDITEDHYVIINLDLANQEKLENAEVSTFDGGIKITTTELPTENIQTNIVIWKTTDAPGESPIDYSYDYEDLINKPRINNVQLYGNKESSDIHVADESEVAEMTSQEIEALIDEAFDEEV